jgi:hypothetical protein
MKGVIHVGFPRELKAIKPTTGRMKGVVIRAPTGNLIGNVVITHLPKRQL